MVSRLSQAGEGAFAPDAVNFAAGFSGPQRGVPLTPTRDTWEFSIDLDSHYYQCHLRDHVRSLASFSICSVCLMSYAD